MAVDRLLGLRLCKLHILESFPPSCEFLTKLSINFSQSALLIFEAFKLLLNFLKFLLELSIFLSEFLVDTNDIFAIRLKLLPVATGLLLKQIIPILKILICFLTLLLLGFYLIQLCYF